MNSLRFPCPGRLLALQYPSTGSVTSSSFRAALQADPALPRQLPRDRPLQFTALHSRGRQQASHGCKAHGLSRGRHLHSTVHGQPAHSEHEGPLRLQRRSVPGGDQSTMLTAAGSSAAQGQARGQGRLQPSALQGPAPLELRRGAGGRRWWWWTTRELARARSAPRATRRRPSSEVPTRRSCRRRGPGRCRARRGLCRGPPWPAPKRPGWGPRPRLGRATPARLPTLRSATLATTRSLTGPLRQGGSASDRRAR